jgi:hypothetical protein
MAEKLKYQTVLDGIREHASVDNWDGKGSSAIPSLVVDIAEQVLARIVAEKEPFVGPGSGDIDIIWEGRAALNTSRASPLFSALDNEGFSYCVHDMIDLLLLRVRKTRIHPPSETKQAEAEEAVAEALRLVEIPWEHPLHDTLRCTEQMVDVLQPLLDEGPARMN